MSDKHGLNDDQLLQALEAATVDFHTGNHVMAESVYRGALGFLDERRPELITCLKNLGEICAARGDFPESIRLNIRLLSLSCARAASNDAAETMVRLASLYEITGRLQEAEYMFNRAQALQEQYVWDELRQPGDGQGSRPGGHTGVADLITSSPPWLQQAFDEANKRYGIRTSQPEQPQMAVAYEAPNKESPISFTPQAEGSFGRTRLSDQAQAPPEAQQPGYWGGGQEAAPAPQQPQFRPGGESASGAWSSQAPQQGESISDYAAGGGGAWQEPAASQGPEQDESILDYFARRGSAAQEPQQDESMADHFARRGGAGQDPAGSEAQRQGTSQEIRKKGVSHEIRRQAISSPRERLTHSGSNSKLRQEHQTREIGPVTVPTEDIVRNLAGFWEQAKAMFEFIYHRVGPQYKFSLALIACVAAMLVCMATSWVILPKQKPHAATLLHQQYKSVDGDKLFTLVNDHECEFEAGPNSMRMNYRVFKGDFKDSEDIALGALSERQYWIRHTDEGLVDADGTVLYLSGSPELELAGYIDNVNSQAGLVFNQTGHYPDKFSDDVEAKLAYTNPFTKKMDYPKLQILSLGSKDSTSEQADYMRHELYYQVRTGQGWKDRADLYPGCIYCCSVQLNSPRGIFNFFLVQPADKNSKPFTSSLKGERYYTALEDGKFKRFEPPALPFNGGGGLRTQVTWLIESDLDHGQMDLLKHGGSYFFGFLTFLLVVVYASVRPDMITKILLVPAIAGALITTLIYACSAALP